MMMRSLFFLAIFAFIFSTASAQTVKVTGELTKYKRTGVDVSDFKRDFEINYPRFSGRPQNVLDKLKAATDYWEVFNMSLDDNLQDDDWLSNCDYAVKYNAKNVLSISLTCDGAAAYVSAMTKYLTFDLTTGDAVQVEDLFKPGTHADVAKAFIKVMKANESKMDAEAKEYLDGERESYPDSKIAPDKMKLSNLDGFSLTDKGIIFIYEYNFANIAKAYEPDGEFFVTFAELKPFIKPDGLLGAFIR